MLTQFSRTELLLGKEAMDRLANAKVAVFGIGGVGGYVCEALVRSGVGAFDLIDDDKVCLTNLNRQIIATRKTIGKYKTDVMKERILEINPKAEVTMHKCFFLPENAEEFPFEEYDYVVDAVDTVTAKIELVMKCKEKNVPIISSMGAGNKFDPTAFQVADIYKTSVCPLAKVMRRELKKRGIKKLKVVYTPLHGTGNTVAERLLKEIGIENLYVVPEQKDPDGNFPTVDYPNPEDKKAFKLALELAKKVDADVVLATDPDADRLGIYAKDSKTGEYMTYTGNMSALLIAEYRISQMKEKGLLPADGMFITTIVSSELAKAIAKNYGLECIEVLTGFKNIGAVIKKAEEKKDKTYVFGFEESYGCLIGDYARDKDGISAVMSLCEAAAYYKSKGMTLWDQMMKIYEKYGFYKEDQVSIVLEGADGAEKIKSMMTNMRNNLPEKIGKYKVIEFKDVELDEIKNLVTGEQRKTGLPKSNVLYYELENNAWCCVRPSGTEPKIKLYMGVKADSMESAEKDLEELKDAMVRLVK